LNPQQAAKDWPPVVVASVFQTGLNLMRDLLRRGVRALGVDCLPQQEGFRSIYGKSYLCPNPDTHPTEWVTFMRSLPQQLGARPVLIPTADMFVSALGCHADELQDSYIFSRASVSLQAALATKEQQYALAGREGFPCPRTAYIQSPSDLDAFLQAARFPCLLKPRHQREWDALPEDHPLRGRKLIPANTADEMIRYYKLAAPNRPEVVAQEMIEGPDDAKYCYLSVYGNGAERLGYCVVREFRSYPMFFGSASVVEPVIDEEISGLCDRFLRAIGYIGPCEIEVKRDIRDGAVRLIEINPRISGTGDCSIYAGVDVGWLHYLDLIGQPVNPVEASRFNFRHVTIRRDAPAFPQYLDAGLTTWREWFQLYRSPLEFYDFDLRDWRVTSGTLYNSAKGFAAGLLRHWRLRS
jgi:D-aspartate ligase